MPSMQRMLIAAIALPFGSVPSPKGWMPQVAQKRCLIACLLNVYVDSSSSPAVTRSVSRGTNHNSQTLRWQIEQLHDAAPSFAPSASNVPLPQWQLPTWEIGRAPCRERVCL